MQQKNLVLPPGFAKEIIKVANLGGFIKGVRLKRIMEEVGGDKKSLHGNLGAMWDIGANFNKNFQAGMAARSGQKVWDHANQILSESKNNLYGLGSSVKNAFKGISDKEKALGRKLSSREKMEASSGAFTQAGEHVRGLGNVKNKHFEKFMGNVGKARSHAHDALNPDDTILGRTKAVGKATLGGGIGMGVIGAGTVGYDSLTRDPSLLYNAGMGNAIRAGASWY